MPTTALQDEWRSAFARNGALDFALVAKRLLLFLALIAAAACRGKTTASKPPLSVLLVTTTMAIVPQMELVQSPMGE